MILFLAGTSDARELAIHLQHQGYSLVATVVTESAAESLKTHHISYHVGRLSVDEMVGLIQKHEMNLCCRCEPSLCGRSIENGHGSSKSM